MNLIVILSLIYIISVGMVYLLFVATHQTFNIKKFPQGSIVKMLILTGILIFYGISLTILYGK